MIENKCRVVFHCKCGAGILDDCTHFSKKNGKRKKCKWSQKILGTTWCMCADAYEGALDHFLIAKEMARFN